MGKLEKVSAIKIRLILYFEGDFNKAMAEIEQALKKYEHWRWEHLKFPITIDEILELKWIHQYFWKPEIRAEIGPYMVKLKEKWGQNQ